MEEEINREDVLQSKFKQHGNIYRFLEIVKITGYKYFEWNGRIYERYLLNRFRDTGQIFTEK